MTDEPFDYRQCLRRKGLEPRVIERTEKRPGEIEFVYQNGDYRAVRVAQRPGCK